MIFYKNVIEWFGFNSNMSLELLKIGFKKLQLKHYKLTGTLKLGHKFTVILKQIIDVSSAWEICSCIINKVYIHLTASFL